jgi:hypothetical protein
MANKPAGGWLNETAMSFTANNIFSYYTRLAKSWLQAFNGMQKGPCKKST